ncbi:DegT/DnrJ/EryC1/StrS family aminotransferase [Paenibacillus pinihumi]|uniref:DegT/DnrJ/EryC1/StrS family aminotransferase n=1 Tax=Paenibacillus pinihumi TaxID=669462 RepID=UPI0004021E96|nr:DegT/DnrJ/EryC1/StrS family aminotransferase [Paenibacillus pinihumi]
MGVPFHRPYFDLSEVEAVTKALKRHLIGTGPIVSSFEKDFRQYIGAEYAIAVNSCTSALHLALDAMDISPGDEVITTPLTFCATILAIEYLGAVPVFADIDPVSLCLDPKSVAEKVTDRTKAIMPVHYAGYPCDLDALQHIASQHGLAIIEDAAHAFSTTYKGRRIGQALPNTRSATCFSFHATKALSIGDGGMIVTSDQVMADKMVRKRLFGMTRLEGSDPASDVSLQYTVDTLGYKYNMTDIEAAIGREQLKKAETMHELRKQAAAQYLQKLDGIPGIQLPTEPVDGEHSWHLFVIRVPQELRSRLIKQLNVSGIKTTIHFTPVYRFPYFRPRFPKASFSLPHTEKFADQLLSLPIFPGITDDDLETVSAAICDFMRKEGG